MFRSVHSTARRQLTLLRPDAISTMIDALRSASQLAADPIQLPRALLLLLHVTKELATGRLSRTRQALQAATPEIVRVLGRIYIETVQSWQSSLSNDSGDPNELVQSMQSSLLAIKTLRRLFIAGYEFPNRDSDVHEFWQITSDQVGLIINVLSTRSNTLSLGVSQMIEKHLLQLSKLHLEMAKTHPGAFVLLPRSLELVQAYWSLIKQYGDHFGTRTAVVNVTIGNVGDQVEDKPFMEKITLKGILLIRACIKLVFNPSQTFKYRHDQEKVEKADATKMIQEQLLTHSFVQELMEVVVTKFFVFRDVDLREWEEDPEEWEQTMDSEAEGFEFSVRPCAEKLFLDLALNYRELLLQPLLSVFNSVASKCRFCVCFSSDSRWLTSQQRQTTRIYCSRTPCTQPSVWLLLSSIRSLTLTPSYRLRWSLRYRSRALAIIFYAGESLSYLVNGSPSKYLTRTNLWSIRYSNTFWTTVILATTRSSGSPLEDSSKILLTIGTSSPSSFFHMPISQ